MHALSSSYQNGSSLNIPRDHPFRASLPPRLHISADGDILSAVIIKPSRRHVAIVDGMAIHSYTADLLDLGGDEISPDMRPTSAISMGSASSRSSTCSTASAASTSATLISSNVSRNSESKLIRTLGSDLLCNLTTETFNSAIAPHCLSPREVIRALHSRKAGSRRM